MSPAEKTFQGLRLLRSCGGGAYGEVWYCEDLSGRRMAVKIVSKTRLGDAWKRELQGVINYRRITENSPYLLRIFHVAEDGENFYYTMEAADSASDTEYVPDTLAHRLQSGPLPPEQLYPVLTGICNGVAAIHQAGLAHRDIKPDNIIFVDGVPKLSDIGLVSSLSNSLTRLAGTLDFLPPEERGGNGSTDRASRQRNDLYAFGKVVYCAATGLEPGRYPSLPTNARLSPELRLFLRLSFKLCAGDSHLRTDDLPGLYKELERIGRQLRSGETSADKLRCFGEYLSRKLLAGVLGLRRWWPVFVLMALLFGGVMYYLRREYRNMMRTIEGAKEKTAPRSIRATKPEPTSRTVEKTKPTVDPTSRTVEKTKPTVDHNTRTYVNRDHGFTMRVPLHWEQLSRMYIEKQLRDQQTRLEHGGKTNEAEKFRLEHLRNILRNGGASFRCDIDAKFSDSVEIAPLNVKKAELWGLSDEDIRGLYQLEADKRAMPIAFYSVGRAKVAGRDALLVESSNRVDAIRSVSCMVFVGDDKILTFALSAKRANFAARKREFDAALKTLRFAAPSANASAPPQPMIDPPPKTAKTHGGVYDLSHKKVATFKIGGSRIAKGKDDHFLEAEAEIPGTWFDQGGIHFAIGEKLSYDEHWSLIAAPIKYAPVFSIENRYIDRADSNIYTWDSGLVSADRLLDGSPEQLKEAIKKDFYFDYALSSTRFWEKLHSRSLEIPMSEALKSAKAALPQESIIVGEPKRFSVDGQPAVYAEIESPLSHRNRKFVYCLVAVKGLKKCQVIMLDAAAEKENLRKEQFFEFCRHFRIFTK